MHFKSLECRAPNNKSGANFIIINKAEKFMKSKFCVSGITSCFLLVAVGAAWAGPPVQITFKNNSDQDAVYDPIGSSAVSYAAASPKPAETVRGGESFVFNVTGGPSPDITSAIFQYKIESKICKFKTAYQKLPGRAGVPKWTKSDEPSGGARCNARIVTTSASTHAWAVEFTMR